MKDLPWSDDVLKLLSVRWSLGYSDSGDIAAEPTALAVLALVAHQRWLGARSLAGALASMQQSTGAVGVRPGEGLPGWTTGLAVSAWCAADKEGFHQHISRGAQWLVVRPQSDGW